MPYRDRLHAGSFRGAKFSTPSDEYEGGRRGVVHEYPKSDKHSTQDLGQAADRFTVTAVIVGDDYDRERDALIAALKKGGPGKLVHRFYGEMDAELEPGKPFRVVQTEDQGRCATFTIPFIRSGAAKAPAIGIDSAAKVRGAADRAKTASVTSFAKKVNTNGPEFVRTEVIGAMARANAVISRENSRVSGALGITSGVAAMITSLGNSAATLVASPLRVTELAESFYAIPQAVFGAVMAVGNAFKRVANAVGIGGGSSGGIANVAPTVPSVTSATGLGVNPATKAQLDADASAAASASATAAAGGGSASSRAAQGSVSAAAQTEGRKIAKVNRQAQSGITNDVGADEAPIATTTELGIQRAQNQEAVVNLPRQAAAIEAARASVDLPYDSHATAIAMRDQLVQALATLAEQSNDDDVYAALVDLRVEVSRHLTQVAGDLPRVLDYSPRVTLPSVLIAHLVHGDATRCEEIIARNNIRHAGFVPGGVAIQVLADA